MSTTLLPESVAAGGFHCISPPRLELPCGLSFLADLHLGSAHTDYDLLQQDLARAKDLGDRILINGDVFDGIFPGDKRFTPAVLHPRLHGCSDLVNKLLDWAVELLLPVADQIDVIGVGNHDTDRKTNADLVLLLVDRLNNELTPEAQIAYGGYSGFVLYPPDLKIFYHHGHGAGQSFGDFNASLLTVENVEVVWLGHRHAPVTGHVSRISPPCGRNKNRPTVRDIRLVRTGSYVRSHFLSTNASVKKRGRQASYALDLGFNPVGLGCARLLVDKTQGVKVLQ